MAGWTYYQWLGGDAYEKTVGLLRLSTGGRVEIFDRGDDGWVRIPSAVLLDRLADGAMDIDQVPEQDAERIKRIVPQRR